MVEKVLQLKCYCNNYPWGKKGTDSLAARLCEKTPGNDFKIDPEKDYAEMWFGTYPELPSYVLSGDYAGRDLQDVLDENKDLIGQPTIEKFGHSKIPFLPKVLSIAKALPLQTHPNKELAAKLHEKDPEQFTDPNHKPEIAIALGDFEAFVGWKPIADIESVFALEPLQRYMTGVNGKLDDKTLKKVVHSILVDSDESIAEVQEKLKALPKEKFGGDDFIPKMLPRLQGQYDKTDPGNLVALLTMNYLTLSKGESIHIPADGIHAYLAGDIIECMARSNNVLNTGFCPRAERNSADTFIDTLTFTPHTPESCYLKPTKFDGGGKGTQVYAPPLSEFDMLCTKVQTGEKEEIRAIGGPSMMIVTEGEGTLKADGKEYELKEGYIFFVGQGVKTEFEASKDLVVYRAFHE